MSDGRWIGLLDSSSSRRHVSTWSGSKSESPIELPLAARNVKHIAPPIARASTVVQQRLDDAELVRHLGPAENGDERAVGLRAQPHQHVDLAVQQPTGGAGDCLGGPTIEAWARCDAPKASLT